MAKTPVNISRDTVSYADLEEYRRALRKLEKDGPWRADLRAAGKESAELVAVEARQRAPFGSRKKRKTEHLRSSIKASGYERGGKVSFGSASAPHAAPIEFGGTLPRHNSEKRTRIKRQPYIYPALREKRDEVLALFVKRVDEIMDKYIPEGL